MFQFLVIKIFKKIKRPLLESTVAACAFEAELVVNFLVGLDFLHRIHRLFANAAFVHGQCWRMVVYVCVLAVLVLVRGADWGARYRSDFIRTYLKNCVGKKLYFNLMCLMDWKWWNCELFLIFIFISIISFVNLKHVIRKTIEIMEINRNSKFTIPHNID